MPRFPVPPNEARVRKPSPFRALLAPLALLALGLADASAQGRVDVLNRDRVVAQQLGVNIVKETLDEVVIELGGNKRTYKTADVAHVEYGPGSASYERGLKALAENDLLNAEALFAAAASDASPAWVAPHALLRQAETAARRGDSGLKAARDAIAAFLTRNPDHRLLPQALLAKARYAASAGDRPVAEESIASVLKLASEGRISADWTARARLLAGDLALADERVADARAAYEAASADAEAARSALAQRPDLEPVLAELALAARVGVGSCLLATDDVAGARAWYARLAVDGAGRVEVQAAAANGVAECDFRDPARLKEAQHAFAKVALTAVAVPTERARALYFLGRCSAELDAAGAEPGGRATARTYFQEVVRRYPDTRWAHLAQDQLP